MKAFAKSLIAGVVLATSALSVQTVHAADINRAFTITLTPDAAAFGDSFGAADSGKTFRDLFSFSALSASDIDAALVSVATKNKLDLVINAFNLLKGGNLVSSGTQISSGPSDLWSLNYPAGASGVYTLEVQGQVLGQNGGSFGGNLNVSPAPEPATWGMLLGGFGVLGLIGRRRKSAGALPA